MAEKQPIKKEKSPLLGAQAKPVTLDKTNKLDIDTEKAFVDNIIEAGISGGLDIGALEDFTSISNSREQMYNMIDTMAADSTVSSIIRTYAEDVCEMSDNGHIIWCESADPNISKFVNYLLNTMNADKNIYTWVYNLIKYGDVYLKLFRESDYKDLLFKKDNVDNAYSAHTRLNESKIQESKQVNENVNLNIHTISDPYSYYVEMVADPGTMFELTKFGKTYGYIETPNDRKGLDYLDSYIGSNTLNFNGYKMKSNDVNIYQADDYVHACLEDNFTRYPETVDIFMTDADYNNSTNSQSYTVRRGKSMLLDSYKIWREKSLLETAALMNRITKSSLVRNIQVEVGDMPKSQVQSTLRKIKELFEQKAALNTGTGFQEYTNPGPIENNIFTATHNGQGAITITDTGGDVDVKNLADLDWWNNKFYASYGIPKAFFGWTDDAAGFNGGTSLSIISSTYSKGVKHVQNAIIQALTDVVNLFLINRGCNSYLNNFVLKMKTPLSQEEKDYREDLTNRINAISNMQSLFTDIEDKGRRLNILKNLLATLNYGDDLIQIIDDEIEDADLAKEAEEEEASADETGNLDLGLGAATETEAPAESADNSDSEDLGMSSVATTDESFTNNGGEEHLVESTDFLLEDELPTPEEVNKSKDFTKNDIDETDEN